VVDVPATWCLLRTFGPGWVLFRAIHACKIRLGVFRRKLPVSDWQSQPLSKFLKDPALDDPETYHRYRTGNRPAFLFDPGEQPQFAAYFKDWDSQGPPPVSASERIQKGEFCYFQHAWAPAGFPFDWHLNPFTRQGSPRDCHWSDIGDFDHGDIKVIWELNRFGFVYPLVRAYWRTGDEGYAELFWRLAESWMRGNPPHQGANWKCGQEISFRVMAWCFGLYGFLESGATTLGRVSALARMIACSGERIASNIDYALSQQNNHAISEAAGLWTIGVLFPEFRLAEKWEHMGREILESQGMLLIYDDGSFAQHSVVYQRLVMQAYLWVLRLGDIHKKPFSNELKGRLAKAAFFLYQLQDQESGRTPYYGQNDGSDILPLNNCDHLDFRPIVQAIHYLVNKTRCYKSGPWDEDLLWIFGKESLAAPVESCCLEDHRASIGGYYTLRSPEGFLFTRCASFRHRPSQADMLSVDVWWRGVNIALDPGTYSYNAEPPWDNALARTVYHNTVSVDDRDQMERKGKFLWLPWISGRVLRYHVVPGRQLAYWEGEHDGYVRLKSLVRHCRGILRLAGDHWLVADALHSQGLHRYRVHWMFHDCPYQWDGVRGALLLQTGAGDYHVHAGSCFERCEYSLVRGDGESPRGWRAPSYFSLEPALSIAVTASARIEFFWTILGPDELRVTFNGDALQVDAGSWSALIGIQCRPGMPLIRSVRLQSVIEEQLEMQQ